MSLCDKCYHPGACCKGFILSSTFWLEGGAEGVAAELATKVDIDGRPLPFTPVMPAPHAQWKDEAGRAYGQWLFNCTKLGADGRCTIYEDRPNVCRIFEPLSDRLCVHWRGAEGGEGAYPYPARVDEQEAWSDVQQEGNDDNVRRKEGNDNSADVQGEDAGP